MKFNELQHIQKPQPEPDTYEAGMAQNQLLKIGSHAVRLHNMLDDGQEMESWVAKKIDLASNYVKSVHGYTAGQKAGTYDDDGMSENPLMALGVAAASGAGNAIGNRIADKLGAGKKANTNMIKKEDKQCPPGQYYCKMSGKCKPIQEDAEATDKEIKMAKGIAFDKRNKDNMSKATSTIEKVKKGLSQQPDVADALKTANEDAGAKYFDFENSDEYADNVEKYGDVDKTPLTPQERQQFKKWLIDTANDYSSMALDGVKEIGDDPSAIEDQYHKFIPKIKEYLKKAHATQDIDDFASDVLGVEEKFGDEDMLMNDEGHRQASDFSQHATHYTGGLEDVSGSDFTVKTIRAVLDMIDDDPHIASAMLVFQQDFEGTPLQKKVSRVQASESVSEDAGEGHMSKSQLYQTAKMAIELLDMIRKGDDLEGWVQTKLNLAADYLQAVYHYEDYQKLNPYREEIDGELMQRHAKVIQKNLDEILAKETKTADVDTKPGMMRILKKRVNEVEKEIAKENRKESEQTSEAIDLEEGIKEWGKRLAMAGVIVAGLAGVNSINNAIDNSVPAISAMNTALEMAQDSGNTELAKMIEKDLSDAKVRLSSGKDLGAVADMQDKYAKFMKTEGLAYESRLLVSLKQQLK